MQQINGALREGRFFESVPRFYGSMFVDSEPIVEAVAGQPFAKEIKLRPKESVDIQIPVEAASNFGLTFMAINSVSASLMDQAGVVVGKNLSGSPESGQWFRSIFIDKPVNAGTWKLRLENSADRETQIVLTTWATLQR
jgi:hypothetical protein